MAERVLNDETTEKMKALMDETGASIIWGSTPEVEVILVAKGEFPIDVIFGMSAADGTEYDVHIKERD